MKLSMNEKYQNEKPIGLFLVSNVASIVFFKTLEKDADDDGSFVLATAVLDHEEFLNYRKCKVRYKLGKPFVTYRGSKIYLDDVIQVKW